MQVRLQKLIAGSGLASRRKAEEMIAAGRVTVNGRVVREFGTRVDPERDHVKVNGRHLQAVQPYAYLILNKPRNVMSTLDDPGGRLTVKHFLPGVSVRVFPVGRLDFDGEGLMLLTNHGDLAQALLHPRYHVPKTYLIKVKGVLTNEEIKSLERGVKLEDGVTSPATVKKVRKAAQNSWLEITIHEGRKHQVKRMLESVGHPVLKLMRVRFGPLTLGDLAPGECRYLTDREANALRDLVRAREARGARREARGRARTEDSGLRAERAQRSLKAQSLALSPQSSANNRSRLTRREPLPATSSAESGRATPYASRPSARRRAS